jgi:hypothetical protein
VIETELARVKRDRTQSLILELLAEQTRRTVLRIADNRMAPRRALNANLMRAASFEFDFKPGTDAFDPPQHAITHDGKLAARVAFGNNDRLRHPMPLVQ